MNDPVTMHESDVLAALAELRWISAPSDKAKSASLADMKRQGIPLRSIVEWFKANPKADWFEGVAQVKRPGVVSQRGEAQAARSKEEIESEANEAYIREREEASVRHTEELRRRLAAAGIRVTVK